MVLETEFLRPEELFQFDRRIVDQVAFPVGDRYPIEIMTNYFAYYGGMVRKFKPRRMLEIGVRYGYTAIVCCTAALDAGIAFDYLGLDDESYPPAPGVHVGSCTKANQNFEALSYQNMARAVKWNSFDGLPHNVGTFDMIHIDGNHDSHGVLNDLGHCWPVLNVGGFVLLDDFQMPPIESAITQWLTGYAESRAVVAVQFVENERGHCYIRKTGLTADQLADLGTGLSLPSPTHVG